MKGGYGGIFRFVSILFSRDYKCIFFSVKRGHGDVCGCE